LVKRLNEAGFQLLDTQWTTPHLVQFGAVSIPRREYLHRLQIAIRATPHSLW
jgi:leucyl/phenylalanyl-tRNA--protein transferase